MIVTRKTGYYVFSLLLVLLCLTINTKARANTKSMLILGDSLSAAYGMTLEQGWVSLTEQHYRDNNKPLYLINASISGETSAGALRRLPDLLAEHPVDWLLIELGGNDGLQGQAINSITDNLTAMVQLAKQQGIQVAVMQIRIPPNYGKRYTTAFESLYKTLAEQQQINYLPFFIEDIATQSELMQNDGIHPNQQAQALISRRMQQQLLELVQD
ncbi:arylesterase [Agarivorans sp. QJM3NY_33]|uniref:arylesterase n=1 Tax=Agarivorans sp. QJM3NY_33 TaxID=3421432 RepID=UPI003D7D8F8A